MTNRSFFVRACWDDEAKVYYSESDIHGLHIEAATIEEFEAIMENVARDMIITNHITPELLSSTSLRDLIPSILWNRPDPELACA